VASQLVSDNTTDGNGNWLVVMTTKSLGNTNMPTGDDNEILGSVNKPSGDGDTLIEVIALDGSISSAEGFTIIGNEDWFFVGRRHSGDYTKSWC